MSTDEQAGRVHYIHRLSYTAQERFVGAFVLAGMLLLLLLATFSRETSMLFADKFTLLAHVKDARGISDETQVLMSGVQVGRVRRLDVVGDNLIRVEMEMLERYHPLLHDDARASVSKLSMLGKPSIEIRGGSGARPVIADQTLIPLSEPPNIDQMLADLAPAMHNIQQILERINALSGAVEPRHVKAMTSNISAASDDLPALMDEARAVIAQMNTTMVTVNTELQQVPDLVLRSRQLMDRTDRTLKGVQNTWPLSASMAPTTDQQIVEPRPMP